MAAPLASTFPATAIKHHNGDIVIGSIRLRGDEPRRLLAIWQDARQAASAADDRAAWEHASGLCKAMRTAILEQDAQRHRIAA